MLVLENATVGTRMGYEPVQLVAWYTGETLVFDPCPALNLQLTGDHLCG